LDIDLHHIRKKAFHSGGIFFQAWTSAIETVKFRYQLLLLVEYSFKNIGARTCNKKTVSILIETVLLF